MLNTGRETRRRVSFELICYPHVRESGIRNPGNYSCKGDELLLNFGAKVAMATFHASQCQDGDEVLKCHE